MRRSLSTFRPGDVENTRNQLNYCGKLEGLAHEGGVPDNALANVRFGHRAHDDAGDVALSPGVPHRLQQAGAVEDRHHVVSDDQVWARPLGQTLEPLTPISRMLHLVALIGERHLQQVGDGELILHDQHCGHLAHPDRVVSSREGGAPWSPPSASAAAGCAAAARRSASRAPLRTASTPSNGAPTTMPASVIVNSRIVGSNAPSRSLIRETKRYSLDRSST